MAWRSKVEACTPDRRRSASLSLGILLASLVTATASARPLASRDGTQLDAMVRYLQQAQYRDGGFPASPGAEPNADFTAWTALALAAAGINPREQLAPGGRSAYSYLLAHAGALTSTTDFERELLVVDAAGASPRDFAGRNLVADILARQLRRGPEAGAFSHEAGRRQGHVNDTIFAIIALSPIHEVKAARAVAHACKWLLKVQNRGQARDGGGSWPAVYPDTLAAEPEHNTEMTGAAIQALNAAGIHHSAAQARGLAFLHDSERPDGGFPETEGEAEANVASTAWVVQGIWAAGQRPERWRVDGHEPLGYMLSLQRADGSLQYQPGAVENPVWMTAYAGLAFAGAYLPLSRVPLAERANPPSRESPSRPGPSPSPAGETGQGGQSTQGGGGVLAGGGGNGAPAFSHPQPQSRGHTFGARRELTPPRATGAHPAGVGSRAAAHGRRAANRAAAGAGDASGALGRALGEAGAAAVRTGGAARVRGVLLGDSPTAFHGSLEGAPGLREAGAGGRQSRWLAIAIAVAALALALIGARLERRRPRVTL